MSADADRFCTCDREPYARLVHTPSCPMHPLNRTPRRFDCKCGRYTVNPECPQHGRPVPGYGMGLPYVRRMPDGISAKIRDVALSVMGDIAEGTAFEVAFEDCGTVTISVTVPGKVGTTPVTLKFTKE